MSLRACVFATALGWLGFVGDDRCVWRLTLGHRGGREAWERLRRACDGHTLVEANWYPRLRKRLEQYATGQVDSFEDIRVRIEHRTPFQQRVLLATRAVEFGETVSYGELAARVGAPRAARAVGAVMASNEVPIIIPCHRVLGSGGRLGGFSAPQGITLKRRMLDLEALAANRCDGT